MGFLELGRTIVALQIFFIHDGKVDKGGFLESIWIEGSVGDKSDSKN